MPTSQIYRWVNWRMASVWIVGLCSSPVEGFWWKPTVSCFFRPLTSGGYSHRRERSFLFPFSCPPSKIWDLKLPKTYFSFMQSTSSVTGIALVLRSKSVLDLLPLYVDLHLSNMIFLKYFMVLFFTVTKHIVFIMLLLMAMHSTM